MDVGIGGHGRDHPGDEGPVASIVALGPGASRLARDVPQPGVLLRHFLVEVGVDDGNRDLAVGRERGPVGDGRHGAALEFRLRRRTRRRRRADVQDCRSLLASMPRACRSATTVLVSALTGRTIVATPRCACRAWGLDLGAVAHGLAEDVEDARDVTIAHARTAPRRYW